ncbi:type II secretion system F family protein [Candidatus Venteria ishoeyi]|uniref:Type II secretion system protein F n=1 Tax=Candidatus Venteria ishoeyi TaxID=1899563 RepID=A0A1H6FC19_9GAMM|nr:type II secretion system F family protein [Candidatus Venteria ishoeyi]MDM8545735.1 type II secretion system F family protein [Candidatus Venteria ishoeyi]SEH07632.1 Type II secretion system protein F [Candidatus Venteria ishoeyi]
MTQYHYQVLDKEQRQMSGALEANNEREAMRKLQRQGLRILKIENRKHPRSQTGSQRPPKQRDILIVLHELTTLLESGVALIEAVESLAQSNHHPILVTAFDDIASRLRHGSNFAEAIGANSKVLKLPWYVPQLLEAGELTGKVAQALRDGLTQMEYETKIQNDMRNAMIYPAILVFSGIAAVLMIFIMVVPRFAGILKNRAAEDLPFLAKAVINTGMFLNAHMLWIALGIGAFVILLLSLWKNKTWRNRIQESFTRLPLFGEWLLESETARWAAMMGTLLENRVALLHALDLARRGIQLPQLKARLEQVSQAVRAGTPLSRALQDQDAMTATGQNLIRAGERAGELPRMLKSLARLLEESGQQRMKRLLLMIEPIAILVIGSVIGVIITGVILAITSVNQISI